MQSGGQSAGIQLQVGLDLAYFRTQMQKVSNIASSEFTGRLDVRFNKNTLDAELNNLQKAIKRRVYRVEIGGNIDTLPDKIKTLRERLASLEDTKLDVGVGAVKSLSPRDARRIKTDLRTTILDGAKKILIPVTVTPSIIGKDVTNFKQVAKEQLSGIFVGVSIKPSILKQDVTDFTNTVKSKLSGITVSVKAELETASIRGGAKSRSDIDADVLRGLERISEMGAARMSGGGGVTESARREQLKQRLSTGEFDIGQLRALSEQLGVKGGGRFKNTQNLIERIVVEASIEMIKKYLDPQAVMRNPDRSMLGKVLDTFARGVFNMLGMDPASIRAQQQASKPKPFTPAGLLPAAYRGIGPSAGPAGLLPPAYRGIGPSAEPAGLLPSLSSAGQSKAIIEALIASTGPRLLPSGGGDDTLGKLAAPRQTKDAVDAILRNYFKVLEVQVREVFSAPPIKKESLNIFDHLDTEQYFNYLAQARVNAENAIKQSIEEAKQVAKQNQVKDAAQSFLRALEETVRNAERSIFLQSRIAANQSYVQKANIREIGQPLLGGRQVAAPKMLSAATGFYRGASAPPPLPETQAQLFARREREARMRSALRGVDVMGETPTRAPARYSYANRPAMPRRPTSAIVPYAAGGALVPAGGGSGGAIPPRPTSGGGGMGGMANFGKALGGINLPGAGVVREIGSEFAMAAKQVLLFGTAYKALAFLTSFPSQVGEAIGALQSFNNTLKAISPSAEEAKASNQFILDIVDRYNVPLQSARDGFTKLYASMAPAGFKGDEIRALFTGVSQAAATFGMSADKVDRVNYAFAQMASKGQVMSEELKGQLGDVLPGAMGIFSEAAGFKGPDAIQKFSKALEDGAYKGEAMRGLLKNVTVVLTKEFGPGAEGAARTFQGVMNRMQNSTKLLYEAFEPVAVGFLNSVVVPLTSGIKTVADGFNSFFTGTLAKTAGGAAFAQQLNNLKPAFEGIRENIGALIPSFQIFGKLLLSIAQFLAQLAGNPIVGFLLKVYTNVLLVNTAFTLLGGRIILGLITSVNAAIIRFVAFGYAINAVGIQTTGANTALAGTQLQMLLLQRSTGAALAPVNALLGSLARIAAIGTIAVVLTVAISNYNQLVDAEARLNRLRGEKANSVVGPQGPRPIQTAQERFKGASRETIEDVRGKQTAYLNTLALKRQKAERELQSAQGLALSADADANSIIEAQRPVEIARKKLESIDIDIKNANEVLRLDPRNYRRQAEIATPLAPVTLGGGDRDAEAKKAAAEAARLASRQQQNDIDAANRQNALNKEVFEGKIALDNLGFEHFKKLEESRRAIQLLGLDSIQSVQEQHQQQLEKIELDRIETVRKARESAAKALMDYTAAQNTAAAAGEGNVVGPGAARLPGSISGRLDASGQNGADMPVGPNNTIQSYHNGLVKEINRIGANGNYIVIEFLDDLGNKLEATYSHVAAAVKKGQSVIAGQTIGRFDASGNTKGAHNSVDINSLGNNGSFQRNRETAAARRSADILVTGRVQGRSAVGSSAINTMQRREDKAGGKAEVEQVQLLNNEMQASNGIRYATIEAIKETEALIKGNITTLFPVAEQRLENDLMKIRNQLQLQGMPSEYIDYKMEAEKADRGAKEATDRYTASLVTSQAQLAAMQAKKSGNIALTTAEIEVYGDVDNAIALLSGKVDTYRDALSKLPDAQKASNILMLEGALAAMKNADALKVQQETMALIQGSVESASNSYKGFMKEVAMGGDPSEALKKFQEAITDQVLTVFFDFAMKPVEDFFKNQLSAMFGVETEESAREKAIAKMEEQLVVLKDIKTNTAVMAGKGEGQSQSTSSVNTAMQSVGGVAFDASIGGGQGFDAGSVFSNPEALSGAFTGIQASISESMNGIVSSFESGALGLSSVLPSWSDALATDIPNTLKQSSTNTGTEGNKFQESLGKVTAGIGIAASAIMGIAAGIGQIKEGGTANILGGIGSIFLGVGGALGGIGSLIPKSGKAANGAVWKGGFQAFANGGMVTGPTLGLIGEGKYNEAIVPLPDGRSIPVQFNQQSSLREAMAGGSNNASAPSVLSMTFESTNINGVEYVSRDQLEQAMAQTRRQASRDGAQRGMTMTLDKLQQSPSTRSRLGMR